MSSRLRDGSAADVSHLLPSSSLSQGNPVTNNTIQDSPNLITSHLRTDVAVARVVATRQHQGLTTLELTLLEER